MDKLTFDALFDEQLARRLAPLGFVSKGKTVYLANPRITIALIRLGGRMSISGGIVHVLCFRHSLLRDMTESVPSTISTNVHDYPYKFRPLEVSQSDLVYQPKNLSFVDDRERLVWSQSDEGTVRPKLSRIADNIEQLVLPWAEALSLIAAKLEIERHGENAWCERMWIADYTAKLAAESQVATSIPTFVQRLADAIKRFRD